MFTGMNFLTVLLFVPETRFERRQVSGNSEMVSNAILASSGQEAEKTVETRTEPLCSGQAMTRKKSYLEGLSLWSGVPADENLFKLFIRPFPLIVYPAVIFAFLGYAVSLAWVVAVNILNSFVLQAPPYNWKPSMNGLINLSGFFGNIVGAFAGGWVVDHYSDWRAKKNNGVFQPETRLFLLIIPFFIVPTGCILFGYGVQNTMSWTTLFFGYALIAVGLTAVPVIGLTYVSDCCLPVAADAFLLVNGLKNIVAFGFLFGIVKWVEVEGYARTFGTQAGIFVAVLLLAIPLSMYGQIIRHKTAMWRIIL